jgi:peptidoglycan/xylan/chitin deacetylase (PgdA/CDA1 family)
MPFAARLKILVYVALYLSGWAAIIALTGIVGAPGWVLAVMGSFAAILAVLALDAFHPRVNLFAPAIVRIPPGSDNRSPIALTFDDGPVEPYTREILEILEQYGAKASFFCIGENVVRAPELARAIVARGHTLGNHTQTHRNLMFASRRQIAEELDRCQHSIEDATQVSPRFFRCPKGYKNPMLHAELRRRSLRLVGYGYPIWDVQNPPPDELLERLLSRAASGDVVVMHDGYPPGAMGSRDSLVTALPAMLEGLRARGLTPVSLGSMAGRI